MQQIEMVPVPCNEIGHDDENIKYLCLNPGCKESSTVCSKCSMKGHVECKNEMKELEVIPQYLSGFQYLYGNFKELQKQIVNLFNETLEKILEIFTPIFLYQQVSSLKHLKSIGNMLRQSQQQLIVERIDSAVKIMKELIEKYTDQYMKQRDKIQQCQYVGEDQQELTNISKSCIKMPQTCRPLKPDIYKNLRNLIYGRTLQQKNLTEYNQEQSKDCQPEFQQYQNLNKQDSQIRNKSSFLQKLTLPQNIHYANSQNNLQKIRKNTQPELQKSLNSQQRDQKQNRNKIYVIRDQRDQQQSKNVSQLDAQNSQIIRKRITLDSPQTMCLRDQYQNNSLKTSKLSFHSQKYRSPKIISQQETERKMNQYFIPNKRDLEQPNQKQKKWQTITPDQEQITNQNIGEQEQSQEEGTKIVKQQ